MKRLYFLKFFSFLICFIFFLTLTNVKVTQAQELSEDIAIAAMVQAWLYLEVSPLEVNLEPALVEVDGSFNIGTSSDIILRIGTSNPDGWDVKIGGVNNGLKSLATDYLISSVNGTSTLIAGTNGYGANATNTLAGVVISEFYNYYNTDTVGEIVNQYRVLASINNSHLIIDAVKIQIKAAASIIMPADSDYLDIVMITIVPRI